MCATLGHRGRPRKHASDDAKSRAFLRRAAGQGLVRVSVLVPASRVADVRAMAAALRNVAAKGRTSSLAPAPGTPRPWSPAEDTELRSGYEHGATPEELTSGLDRTLDEVVKRLAKLEVATEREARAELKARARAPRC